MSKNKIKKMLFDFRKAWHIDYFVAIMLYEKNLEPNRQNINKLRRVYHEFMEQDHIQIISEDLTDLYERME